MKLTIYERNGKNIHEENDPEYVPRVGETVQLN